MSNWTKPQARALGDFLLAHLDEAKAAVRQQEASANRGHDVSREDATMLDSYDDQSNRDKAVKLAALNVKRELNI